MADHPCGANGCRWDSRACGREVATAASRSVTSKAARASWSRPETFNPTQLARPTTAIRPAAVTTTVVFPPPSADATYAPPNSPAAAEPGGTAK